MAVRTAQTLVLDINPANVFSANFSGVSGALANLNGTLTANELHVTYTSSSVVFTSGSTKFGDTQDDTHEFTGSVSITGYKLPIQAPNSGSWTFITDGSDTLTWTQSSGLVLSGTTDNGVITLNGSYPNATVESNMTFDGTTLNVFSNSCG